MKCNTRLSYQEKGHKDNLNYILWLFLCLDFSNRCSVTAYRSLYSYSKALLFICDSLYAGSYQVGVLSV